MEASKRPPTHADLDAVFAIHADPRTNAYNLAGPMRERSEAERKLGTWLDDWRSVGIGYWTIERRPDATVIGFVGVRAVSVAGRDLFNLYYRLAPVAWGHGLARRFAREAVALAQRDWPDRAVVARMWPANVPSERTALAVGLQHVGHDQDGRLVLANRPLDREVLASL